MCKHFGQAMWKIIFTCFNSFADFLSSFKTCHVLIPSLENVSPRKQACQINSNKKKKRRGVVLLKTELSDNYNGILVHIISLPDLRCRH